MTDDVAPCFGDHRFTPSTVVLPDGGVLHCCDNCETEVVHEPGGEVVPVKEAG